MSSISKKEKDINKSLDRLYNKDKNKIISWLNGIKIANKTDGKISGLLNDSKIQIITATEDGQYNLILKWIAANIDKFADYDFKDIPDSSFISLKDIGDPGANTNAAAAAAVSRSKTFSTPEDVQRWCNDPEKHPTKGTPMSAMEEEYFNIYQMAFKIMRKNKMQTHDIRNMFPKNHILFGDIDLLYYTFTKKNDLQFEVSYDNYYICKMLADNLDNFTTSSSINETEIGLLRNRFSNVVTDKMSNLQVITYEFEHYNKNFVYKFLLTDYMALEFPESLNKLADYDQDSNFNIFIKFLENSRFSVNDTTILDFLEQNKNDPNINEDGWITNALKLYNSYKVILDDIRDCFDPLSGIVENFSDKKLVQIADPLEDFFADFEEKLEEIKKPMYSQLIDISTFKEKNLNTLNYLNDADYAVFKTHRDAYDNERKSYEDSLKIYERNPQGSSPRPPKKPKITLPSGKEITIALQKDPIYIKDAVIRKFAIEYRKVLPTIEEYNRIKNMSYVELKTYMGKSPSSSERTLMQNNDLFGMTRENINDNVLYSDSASGLADRCSEEIDILTNDELNNENYPLAKLQLMVRLKVYTATKQNYRTECIYAPSLYNYLIKCINNKEPFINPITKTRYTKENIDELMKVMKIIDPSLEIPEFIKHRNDTKLKINYSPKNVSIHTNAHPSFAGHSILNFYNVYLSRVIGGKEYNVYNICTIPADMEASGDFATGSTDLTSTAMLFKIFKLFNDGHLLHKYVPPYRIIVASGRYQYIKLGIHFNRYLKMEDWIINSDTRERMTKAQMIEMFKHYAQEINNFIY